MPNQALAAQLYEAAIESHKATLAYLTGVADDNVNVYPCERDSSFAQTMAIACMKNATWARKMLAVIKARDRVQA